MIPVEGAGWSCLPAELLLRIFDNLSVVDFVTASCTCSHWRQVFHESPMWKRRCFDFGKPATFNLKRIKAFVACTGRHLKDLRIICSETAALPPKDMKCLDTLFSSLSNLSSNQTTIRCFRVEQLDVYDNRDQNYLHRLSCVISLGKFIQQQRNLEELHLKYLDVDAPFDNIIFQSIVESLSLKKLKILHLIDFPCSCFCIETFTKHGLKGCDSLQELAINYSLLTAVKFDHHWSSFQETLRVLHVHCSKRKDAFPAKIRTIESAWWRQLVFLFPRVQVFFTINETMFDVSKYMVEGIPLVGFSWKEHDDVFISLTEIANKYLHLLVKYYSQTLRSVSLDAGDYGYFVCKERVSRLVRSCPNLSEVSLSSRLITRKLLEEIQGSVLPRANNVDCVIRII